jgi:hypothetical protein
MIRTVLDFRRRFKTTADTGRRIRKVLDFRRRFKTTADTRRKIRTAFVLMELIHFDVTNY